jgi:hypothetical protein
MKGSCRGEVPESFAGTLPLILCSNSAHAIHYLACSAPGRSGVPVSGGSGEDSPELEFGEVRAGAGGALVFEFAPEAFSGAVSQGGIDVAHGVPCRLVELYRAGDGVAEEQGAFLAGRDHYAYVTGSVPWRE